MLLKTQQAFANALNKASDDASIQIYQESINASFCLALAEIYPVCKKLVGEDFFNAMVSRYIAITPSESPDLAQYGKTLADFIDDFPPAKSLPYLPDVARLDLAIHEAFLGPDNDLMQTQRLEEAGSDDLLFHLPKASTLLCSDFPIHKIWEANQLPEACQPTIDLSQGGVNLLVWRYGLDFRLDVLTKMEWSLLSHINKGLLLQDVSEDSDLVSLLPKLIAKGWINDFRVGNK